MWSSTLKERKGSKYSKVLKILKHLLISNFFMQEKFVRTLDYLQIINYYCD